MAEIQRDPTDLTYVAPAEAPPPRRPPVSEVGVINWLRENLFSNVTDTILTLVMAGLIGWFLNQFFGWALFEAQWEVDFLNLRQIGVGSQFPADEVWRAELSALIVIFLSLMSVGIWGRLTRGVVVGIAVVILLMYVVPAATQDVPEPRIHFYADADYNLRQVNFIGQSGNEVTFTIDPLTEAADFDLAQVSGFIGNNNQQGNTSFDAYTEASTEVVFTGVRIPEEYDLSLAVQVWDAEGNVLAESEFTNGSTESTELTWEAPETGWYTFTMVRDDEVSTVGAAWLKIDGVEVFRSTRPASAARIEQYGEPPELDCEGCATEVNRTDMRFEGRRTLGQWFSLQLSPYLLEIRAFVLSAVFVGLAAYVVGRAVSRFGVAESDELKQAENTVLLIAGAWFIGYIAVQIVASFNPQPLWSDIRLLVLWAFIFTIFVYALLQFAKKSASASTRGISILWMLSVPLILTILSGFAAAEGVENVPLPAVPSTEWGGLLLTLLLSAIAIVASFPIGMALALGRQSDLPLVSFLSTIFIEVVRGVPLITLLFMGRLILPFFGFGLADVDLLIRIIVVLTLFTSAYMAEVIRGGLQIIPKGQIEAAHALGLNNFWTTTLIILPQALRAVIPAMMGQAVSLFKDTSLVFIVGLLEVLGTMNQILGDSQTGYLSFPREGYLYIGILYFVFSYLMADISRRIERTGSGAVRRETI